MIKDSDGNTIASYESDGTTFNSGDARVLSDNQYLYLIGRIGTALLSSFTDVSRNNYQSRVIVKAADANPIAGIEVIVNNILNTIRLDQNNVNVSTPGKMLLTQGNQGNNPRAYEVLATNSLAVFGELRLYGKIPGNSIGKLEQAVPNVPADYAIHGFRSVSVFLDDSTHQSMKRVTYLNVVDSFASSGNTVTAWISNTNSAQKDVNVRFSWIAYKSNGSGSMAPTTPIDIGNIVPLDDN